MGDRRNGEPGGEANEVEVVIFNAQRPLRQFQQPAGHRQLLFRLDVPSERDYLYVHDLFQPRFDGTCP
jgi:hypothetical protein